jgi:single-strand DNA-binding protein
MNKIILTGNLTRDLEMKYTASGTTIGSTGIAVTKKRKDASGQTVEEVMFVDITFWGRTAEIASQYLSKGSKILVEGELKLDTWTDQNGGKRSKHTISVKNMEMLGSRPQGGGQQQQAPAQQQPQQRQRQAPKQQQGGLPEVDIDLDEIPF